MKFLIQDKGAVAHSMALAVLSLGMGAWTALHAHQSKPFTDQAPHAGTSGLYAFSEGLETLSAEFDQTTRDASGYVVERLEGVFSFKAPNQFRWAYSEPLPEIIVGDGAQLWHYDPSLEQVTLRAQPPAAQSPILALTSPSLMAENYAIVGGERQDIVEFFPKAEDAPIKQASVRMENGLPIAVEWQDNFGQVTRIVFSNMVLNPTLEPALFEFQPPNGVDVLEGL